MSNHERHKKHERKKPQMNMDGQKLGGTTENTDERRLTTKDELTDFFLYTAPDGAVKVECILHDETIWLTQKRIAELFGVGVPAISKHLKNIFESGELLEEVVVSILETTTQHGAIEGKTQAQKTRFYNLDAIISVGYRVNSSKATQFRIWATQLLKEYITKGFAESVNRFLEFNEYRILEGYGSVSRKLAEEKAFAEYDKFNKTQRIESDFDKAIKQIEASKKKGGK